MRGRSPKDQASSVGMSRTTSPTVLTRHAPPKNGFPFAPEVILGGFLWLDHQSRRTQERCPRLSDPPRTILKPVRHTTG